MSQTTLKTHFLSFAAQSVLKARLLGIAEEFEYNQCWINSLPELMVKAPDLEDTAFVLFHATSFSDQDLAKNLVELRKILKESFICAVISDDSQKNLPRTEVLKKSGVNLVLFESDVLNSSRLEYVASQVIRASYAQVRLTEFPKNVVLDFTLYHLLPLNQRMLAVLPKGSEFSEARMQKMEGIDSLFVKRDELDRYRNYMDQRQISQPSDMKARARAKYLSYCSSHSQMIFMLIDRLNDGNSREAKWLFDRCEIQSKDLLKSLSALADAWGVLHKTAIGEFGSVERSPTIAAYAGVLSLLASIGEPLDVMMASLLADVGMLDLPPEITKRLRSTQDFSELSPSELAKYQSHPVLSIEHCEKWGLQLTPDIKKMILNSHEKVNQTGFPNRPPGDQIPFEAMLIQLCELIDRTMMIEHKRAHLPIEEIRKLILTQEMSKLDTFNHHFLEKLKPIF